MVDRKRSLRPLETLKKHERTQLYEQVHEMVKNYRYESQAIRLLNFEHDQRILEEKLEEKIQNHKDKTADNFREIDKIEKEKKDKFSETDLKKPKIDEYDMKENKEKIRNSNEERQIKQKEEEIAKKLQEIDEKTREKNRINNQIEIYRNYEGILESVRRKYDDYTDITDLILRYRTLKNSVDNLEKEYSDIEKKTELEKAEFNKQLNFYAEKIGSQASLIHDLEKEIKKMKKEIADGQKSQEQNKIFEIEVRAQRAKIELTIKNLRSKAEKSKRSKKKNLKAEEELKEKPSKIETKDRSGKIDPKKISGKLDSQLINDEEIEDPELLVKMLKEIEDRYKDIREINEWLEEKARDNQPSPEEHLQKSKSQKKNTSIKRVENP